MAKMLATLSPITGTDTISFKKDIDFEVILHPEIVGANGQDDFAELQVT